MQFHLLRALESKLGPANRIAPIDVPEELLGKWISRVQKKLYLPRCYAYYSESRLTAFADAVQKLLPADNTKPVVFFGPLPFVKCRPYTPYYIYTDGAFFIHYWEYNQDHSHAKNDIERICSAEADFMRRAAGVWCSSQWVADRITREYRLPTGLARFVGAGPGDVPTPVEPLSYDDYLVMIAADFERKGGRFAAEVVGALRKAGLEWRIKFIGAKPPVDILGCDFVEWCGWLDLSKMNDRNRFAVIMSGCAAQILPSNRDLTPLAIPEAALYAKPTFAATVGGIPEMIKDWETGVLFHLDETPTSVATRLLPLLKDKSALQNMGNAARSWQKAVWSWTRVAEQTALI